MNKTIKEQAEAYCFDSSRGNLSTFVEHIITEERKRRLPTKEEFIQMDNRFASSERTYDWLLSYESEAVVEDEVKVVNPTAFEMNDFLGSLNRVLLAEKLMIINSNVFFEIEDYRCDDLVHGCFQLADEFIKQAKYKADLDIIITKSKLEAREEMINEFINLLIKSKQHE